MLTIQSRNAQNVVLYVLDTIKLKTITVRFVINVLPTIKKHTAQISVLYVQGFIQQSNISA